MMDCIYCWSKNTESRWDRKYNAYRVTCNDCGSYIHFDKIAWNEHLLIEEYDQKNELTIGHDSALHMEEEPQYTVAESWK